MQGKQMSFNQKSSKVSLKKPSDTATAVVTTLDKGLEEPSSPAGSARSKLKGPMDRMELNLNKKGLLSP
jgi:hypothetical protein